MSANGRFAGSASNSSNSKNVNPPTQFVTLIIHTPSHFLNEATTMPIEVGNFESQQKHRRLLHASNAKTKTSCVATVVTDWQINNLTM